MAPVPVGCGCDDSEDLCVEAPDGCLAWCRPSCAGAICSLATVSLSCLFSSCSCAMLSRRERSLARSALPETPRTAPEPETTASPTPPADGLSAMSRPRETVLMSRLVTPTSLRLFCDSCNSANCLRVWCRSAAKMRMSRFIRATGKSERESSAMRWSFHWQALRSSMSSFSSCRITSSWGGTPEPSRSLGPSAPLLGGAEAPPPGSGEVARVPWLPLPQAGRGSEPCPV
mmetsp:Transcript_100802/g.310799  ORF Transcript_100802/g.310799 Transcript_100802/m.310799 type:complete len:230 (+) Transcript_100802:318-1007(+)